MDEKDIERLIGALDNIELHIQDRRYALETRAASRDPNNAFNEICIGSLAETVAAWEGAKGYILSAFPEVAKLYKPKQHLPFKQR